MKFKLDENFGRRTASIFREFGHDVHSVYDEELGGASDTTIYNACQREQRCLITLDVDFANVLPFHRIEPLASPSFVSRRAHPPPTSRPS